MLSINLTPIFKARGIERPYSFLVKAGFSSHTAHQIVNSHTRMFRLDHIELLCRTLVCEPNDLLEYTPEKDQILASDHPLLKLQPTDNPENVKQTFKTIPFKQLKEITKQINNNPNTK